MSSTTASPQPRSAPVPGRPLPATEPRDVIELYTPTAVGLVGFRCALAAGFVLAALNYHRMGEGVLAA